MTPEERELLTKSIKISEENNRMLRGIRRSARISSFLRVVYWLLILGVAFSSYYFLQPYINTSIKSYNTVRETIPKLPALPSWLGEK